MKGVFLTASLNVIKTIENTKGKVNVRYGLTTSDIVDIQNYNSNPIYLILNGFYLGYAQGLKAAKAEMKGAK